MKTFSNTTKGSETAMHDSFDFEEFLRSTVRALTAYCSAVVGNADAEDAAQEAYLRLHANLYRIGDEKSASAFLYRTAYRVSVDMLRSRRRFREVERPKAQSNALSDRMQNALMRLTPLDRSVIYLRVVEEYEYGEIAEKLGHNEAWARKRYSLARSRLEKYYTEEKS